MTVILIPFPRSGGGGRRAITVNPSNLDLPTPPPGEEWLISDIGISFLWKGPLYVRLFPSGASADAWRNGPSIRRAAHRALTELPASADQMNPRVSGLTPVPQRATLVAETYLHSHRASAITAV